MVNSIISIIRVSSCFFFFCVCVCMVITYFLKTGHTTLGHRFWDQLCLWLIGALFYFCTGFSVGGCVIIVYSWTGYKDYCCYCYPHCIAGCRRLCDMFCFWWGLYYTVIFTKSVLAWRWGTQEKGTFSIVLIKIWLYGSTIKLGFKIMHYFFLIFTKMACLFS